MVDFIHSSRMHSIRRSRGTPPIRPGPWANAGSCNRRKGSGNAPGSGYCRARAGAGMRSSGGDGVGGTMSICRSSRPLRAGWSAVGVERTPGPGGERLAGLARGTATARSGCQRHHQRPAWPRRLGDSWRITAAPILDCVAPRRPRGTPSRHRLGARRPCHRPREVTRRDAGLRGDALLVAGCGWLLAIRRLRTRRVSGKTASGGGCLGKAAAGPTVP